MNRRKFLNWIPKMAGVSAVALATPAVLDKLEIAQMEPPKEEALPPEDVQVMEFERVANRIVDITNGKLRAMSEAEMQERASYSLKAYLERYG